MQKFSNIEAELKKTVAYKESVYMLISLMRFTDRLSMGYPSKM